MDVLMQKVNGKYDFIFLNNKKGVLKNLQHLDNFRKIFN